jgi:uncharacterized protein (DUF3820 family)
MKREKVKLTDTSLCPWGKMYRGVPMSEVPDEYLIWFYGLDDAKCKCPLLYDYVVANAHLLDDLILREEDKTDAK